MGLFTDVIFPEGSEQVFKSAYMVGGVEDDDDGEEVVPGPANHSYNPDELYRDQPEGTFVPEDDADMTALSARMGSWTAKPETSFPDGDKRGPASPFKVGRRVGQDRQLMPSETILTPDRNRLFDDGQDVTDIEADETLRQPKGSPMPRSADYQFPSAIKRVKKGLFSDVIQPTMGPGCGTEPE
jgi:hypothetical protein